MQANVYQYLTNRPELLHFVRMNPSWYRILTRYPERVVLLENSSKSFYGQTFSQKMGKLNEQLNLLSMLLSMSEYLNQDA
ncbi:YlbE-like protein [Salinibacillus kushneri]|uniref:YlbE-like protein n=1 Tax=Salinibacillus kushneri TaxID=237682 RepID=A0A1I0HS29_9BACI|nr:YlbE-like family protein [Salinibacillus kushneri]SET85962.1 YlbE-like protein [Salinibacillus kushneri]